ncbi:cap-specific mRNA (nucleoside-2'-O-)-methyltransferase 2 [Fopius arisanus]|uniref:Cap-specific mRNA (nucleoside-2'-O-)-methyltransferase 2 n=2 Tax=Fopius arisanus TaxID=64838 RepID=A0A9R1SY77_9HYME|nr:PREDICTED: cap-specific mRNA (nucleoside-2'-O-)-methyltransferase 2 [Fopius arisanus]
MEKASERLKKHRPLSFQPYDHIRNHFNTRHKEHKIVEAVERLFSKRFELLNDQSFTLAPPSSMFVGHPWEVEALQALKISLNTTKSRLNDFKLMEWQKHTGTTNQAGEVHKKLRTVINPEFLTQAWCKFYENLSSFPLIPSGVLQSGKLHSIHLCEAPGAFVMSLNHFLKVNHPDITWTWTASTLNPYYEANSNSTMITDDRIILHTEGHWYFGEDQTGNLMTLENLEGLLRRERGKAMLVTADGSISCIDKPDEQEAVVSHLHYCETVAALHLLENGGSFLLKIFTIFEQETVCLLYLMRCCFERVVLNKPATSKEGNSEVYVVCLGFKGDVVKEHLAVLTSRYEEGEEMRGKETSMFRREDLPNKFIEQIIQAGEFFKGHQCQVIQNNIRMFEEGVEDDVWKIRDAVAEAFIARYGVKRVDKAEELVGKRRISMFNNKDTHFKFSDGSFNDRKREEEMLGEERIKRLQEDMQGVPGRASFKFILPNDSGPLMINLGKFYEKIQSSRFCFPRMLKNLISGFHVLDEFNLNLEFPEAAAKTEFIEKMRREDKKVFSFSLTDKVDTNLIEKIYEILESIEENDSIVLLGYCLLSQLNVGILYLLGHAFKTLEIEAENDLGVVVTLENFRNRKKMIDNFREIIEAANNARESNKIVISIFPISQLLCACEMYQSILMINHVAIKHVINHIVEKISRSS